VQLRNQAVIATLLAFVGMILFIWYRYDLVYGISAIIEIFFNVLATLGLFSIFQWEINVTVIAALLTLVGFTVNDAVVIFDRVRENVQRNPDDSTYKRTNDAINQTLSRTVITAGTVFLAVLGLVLFGGPTLRSFSLAMMFGILFGTYSTIAVACPVKVWLEHRFGVTKFNTPTESGTPALASAARRDTGGALGALRDRRAGRSEAVGRRRG
jgi:preprotein translocase subunit SecF